MKVKKVYALVIICFIGVLLFLTFNKHSKSGYYNYHSEIWADKAGYYVYLPAAILYDFDANNFPDSIDFKTGNGFQLDPSSGKVITKYTYGVALMQLPFFCLANISATAFDYEKSGFSPIYHWSINVAAIFYLTLGLLFLYQFLIVRFSRLISLFTVLSIFFATNLYYYAIDDTGMSHVYSFSLFCIFLFFIQKTNYLKHPKVDESIIFGFLVGLIILIRPTNLLFLVAFLFLDHTNNKEILLRVKRLVHPKRLVPMVLAAFCIILPQLIYWQYTKGSVLTYSYGNEGFNWLNPQLLKSWFSPDNGLFLYSPFYFLIIASMLVMAKNKKKNGLLVLILFLLISYVFSSWWSWNFGCSFGGRSYVEYLAIFSLPLAYLFNEIGKLNKMKRISFSVLVIVCTAFNLKMIYSYDGCFYSKSEWDWKSYIELLEAPTK